MAYPDYVVSRASAKKRRTAGDLTLTSTTWADVDVALDMTLNAQVDDEILYGASGMWGSEAFWASLDVVTLSGAATPAPVNSFAARGAPAAPNAAAPGDVGVPGWRGVSSVFTTFTGFSAPYTVVAGDIVADAVTLRLRYFVGGSKTLYASGAPLDVWAINIGPRQGA